MVSFVVINGQRNTINTAEVTEKGKSGVGANKRTAVYSGGGAAIGAIVGGGKGAAIRAGGGAGAGVLTQVPRHPALVGKIRSGFCSDDQILVQHSKATSLVIKIVITPS